MKTMIQTICRKTKKLFFACTALLLIAVLTAIPVLAEVDLYAEYETESNAWENWPEGPALWGDTGCLMDANTGKVLFAKGANAERFPASVTKVMTAIMVVENCSLDDIVTMTETGLADAYGDSSNICPTLGEQFTVYQCLEMLLVKSANDIATQLAEHTSGSVEAFCQAMNERAASLGCLNTHFTNASGLEDDNHYTSAYDMCLIMKEALAHDTIMEIMEKPYIEIPETMYSNARYYEGHVYLRQPDNPFYYEDCFGGKTGYTDISRSTLVCAAKRDGVVLVGAVMGAPDTGTNAEDMVDLFNYGFENRDQMDLVAMETAPIVTEAPTPTQEPKNNTSVQSKTPTPQVTPKAITTSEPKSDIAKNQKEAEKDTPAKTILYIIVICILVAALVAIVLLELRARKIRRQRRRRRR